LSAPAASAQDSHYWTLQFGNRARLLGGAVIGSATDLSAVYYNPGFIAWIEEPELLLSGTVFQYTKLKIQDALGPGEDLETGRFSLSPSLFAGEISTEALGDNRIAYAVLTRQESEFRINERADLTDLFRQELPDLSFVSEGAQLDTRLSEYWIGGSWSRKVSERLAIGVSPFFVIRNHRFRAQELTQVLAEDNQGGIAVTARDFDYQHWRVLAKIGIATQFGQWQIGATVTTPSAGLFGSGTTGFDESTLVTGIGANVNSDFQEGVSSSYFSPLSIGFGGARSFGRSRVHFAAEWFNGVSAKTILEPEPFQSPDGSEIRNDVFYELDPVFNVAVGVENRRQSDLQLYASFWTDFSAAPAQSVSNSTFSTYDLYHLAGGATFKVAESEFTLGVVYAFGNSDLGENKAGFAEDLDVGFRKLTFILGVSFILGR
jgi:hypothetical protein